MWREEEDGWTAGQKICPIMSEPRGMVLCQGKHCAAAYPRNLAGETYWFCEIIEGHLPLEESESATTPILEGDDP
ncbi:MAG: hypothetical protein LUQ37_05490 [Methanoregulaceae archaeon]|nr:hypothetical protein [Methanoregulaceae archaeon]